MEFPTEFVCRRARGSVRQSEPSKTNLYSAPDPAPATKPCQKPWFRVSGDAVELHPLNEPATDAVAAPGAHTRNWTPPGSTVAPSGCFPAGVVSTRKSPDGGSLPHMPSAFR